MRERRLELAALEVRECAKPWPEADADVCEAIDFLEYYARGAIELDRGRAAAAGARRAQRAGLRAARGRRGDLPVELPAGDPVRDDLGGAGGRQRGRAQAGRAVAGDRAPARAGAAGRRRAPGGGVAAAGRGRGRRGAGARSARARDRVHRLAAGRTFDRPRRGRDVRASLQAGRRRAGRQELRDRRRRRRSRRGRAGDRAVGVRVRRAEVLGRLAGAGRRGGRRPPVASGWRARPACCWSGRPSRSRPTCRR